MYKKGMPRFMKKGEDFVSDKAGDHYKDDEGEFKKIVAKKKVVVEEDEDDAEKSSDGRDDVDAFQKSLDQLEALVKSETPGSRKEELLSKATGGEELSADEVEELYKSLGGGEAEVEEAPAVDELTKSFSDSEPLQKALDVSEYLEAQHGALIKSLGAVGELLEKSDSRQHEYNLIFARAMHQVGVLAKSMDERLEAIEGQPVGAPRSRGIRHAGQVIQKSFAGAPGAGTPEGLSKGDILRTLEDMVQKGSEAVAGESLLKSTAKYEQTNQISPALLQAVVRHRGNSAL